MAGTATGNRIACARVGDRNVRISSSCASANHVVGISEASGGIAAHAAHAARASAAHTHSSRGTTTGIDYDMGHAGMSSDDLAIHSDSGHPTSDLGYLLALGFDASRSRELVPVSELQMYEDQTTVGYAWVGEIDVHQDVQ
jgi:hypothetical protein